MSANDTLALFGLPISNVSMAEAVAAIEQYILAGTMHQIATANLDFARNALKDPHLQEIICSCSMVVPDGAPMLWASSALGKPLRERVTGVDLIPELARLSAQRGYGIYLLGSSESSSRRAGALLEQRFPGVRIVGRHSPATAPLERMDHEDLLERIAAARPDILLVAFGNPKQEIWIHRHRNRLKVPVCIGIGGSLDMIAGSTRRAPRWVQRVQLEWAYRMAQEPMRLLPRYLRDAAALATHLPLGVAANRMQPAERRHGRLQVEARGGARILRTPARLSGEATLLLAEEARAAVRNGETLVIDMSRTLRIETDGVGSLLEARRILLPAGLPLWLAGLSPAVRRVLQFSAVADLFCVAETSSDAASRVAFAAVSRDGSGVRRAATRNIARAS